tara:strand:- start:88 stop:291 length:204 start_codon:yes stop_codon:yes gene_type:complete
MKNNKITFYLEFILGLGLILFFIFQASKNINAWFEVPGAFKEDLFFIGMCAVMGTIGYFLVQVIFLS